MACKPVAVGLNETLNTNFVIMSVDAEWNVKHKINRQTTYMTRNLLIRVPR